MAEATKPKFRRQVNLQRGYVYGGVDYGPGPTEFTSEEAHAAIQQREREYAAYLKRGGEPVAPTTPSIAPGTGVVLNRTALPTLTEEPDAPGEPAALQSGSVPANDPPPPPPHEK